MSFGKPVLSSHVLTYCTLQEYLESNINKEGWNNIILIFNAFCNVKYEYIQFKNKQDQLKRRVQIVEGS